MVAAGRGGLELNTPDGTLRVDGRAYHDRNSAALPLDGLGVRSWWWGRLAFPVVTSSSPSSRLHPEVLRAISSSKS